MHYELSRDFLKNMAKASLKFAAAAENKIKSVFPGRMCVGGKQFSARKRRNGCCREEFKALQRAESISLTKPFVND